MRTFAIRLATVVGSLIVLLLLVLLSCRILASLRETGVPPLELKAAVVVEGNAIHTALGDLFVQQRGPTDGVPVVLVHGAAAWSAFWMDVAEALAREGYRVIAIDLPPFGMSPHDPQARYSRQDQARRIQGLMSALSLSGTIIVGHSFGAGPVVETALRYGARIGGMVLIDAALGLPDDGARPATTPAPLAWMLGQPVLLESLIAATATNPLFTRSLLRTMLHRKDAADERQTAILQLPLYNQGATAALARWLPNLLLTDSNALSAQPDNYRSLQLPTAILWGTRDTITPLPQGERLARLIPGATFTTIEDVGHIPHIEDPPALIARLRAALADLTTRARRSSSTKP